MGSPLCPREPPNSRGSKTPRKQIPKVGLEPTRPCGQRILSAVGSDGQVTIASRPIVVTPTSAAFGVGVSQAPNPVFFGLRNRRRNTEPNGGADCDALTRWATPLGQAPQRGPILPHVRLLDFFQISGVRRAYVGQPTPSLRPTVTRRLAGTQPPPVRSADPGSQTRCDTVNFTVSGQRRICVSRSRPSDPLRHYQGTAD